MVNTFGPYQFDFTNLVTHPDFALSLTYDNYVTTTGLMSLAGPAQPTPLGFSVIRAGTDTGDDWGFDGGSTATLIDGNFIFDSNSFVFDSSTPVADYITSPGTYLGLVFGNAADLSFMGEATLVVTSAPSVPEPSASALTIRRGSRSVGSCGTSPQDGMTALPT